MTLHSSLLSNIRRNKWSTLIEVMAMLIIVSLTLTTMYYTLMQSIQFAQDTEARIKAINIAREGIEGMINIRNTNWLRYSSDRANCWNTLNYSGSCIGGAGTSKIDDWDYKIYNRNWLWELSKETTAVLDEFYRIGITSDGWYSGSGNYDTNKNCQLTANNSQSRDCKTIFKRKIVISNATNSWLTATANVSWQLYQPRKVSLSIDITNWKSLYSK